MSTSTAKTFRPASRERRGALPQRLVRHGPQHGLPGDVHGRRGTIVAEQSYNTGDTSFDAQISAITASNPDAIVLITFDEIYTIGPALLAAGYPASQLYLVDGNLKNFGSDEKWPAGSSVEGAKGTTPAGPLEADSGFQDRLNEWWVGEGNTDLTDFSYANES